MDKGLFVVILKREILTYVQYAAVSRFSYAYKPPILLFSTRANVAVMPTNDPKFTNYLCLLFLLVKCLAYMSTIAATFCLKITVLGAKKVNFCVLN